MEIFDKMIIKSGMTKFFFELTNIWIYKVFVHIFYWLINLLSLCF
jgi:hypothetical protein